MSERNPQAEQMADESMVRGLAAQARAIWPQESELFDAYGLAADIAIADIGCGTGEISARLADKFSAATITGVDIIAAHIELARVRFANLQDRLRFVTGDAFSLELPDASFDLVVNRHMLQSVPEPEAVLRELIRILKPGGRLHLLVEDYGMIKFGGARLQTDRFFLDGVHRYGVATGTDLHIGRNCFTLLRQLAMADISVDFVVVDTLRVPRKTFAEILEAWRDGYHKPIAAHSEFSPATARDYFNAMIDSVMREDAYAVWQVPIVAARKPGK